MKYILLINKKYLFFILKFSYALQIVKKYNFAKLLKFDQYRKNKTGKNEKLFLRLKIRYIEVVVIGWFL